MFRRLSSERHQLLSRGPFDVTAAEFPSEAKVNFLPLVVSIMENRHTSVFICLQAATCLLCVAHMQAVWQDVPAVRSIYIQSQSEVVPGGPVLPLTQIYKTDVVESWKLTGHGSKMPLECHNEFFSPNINRKKHQEQ